VMPSRYENFSNAILEAVACGVPFVASDVAGNRILAKALGGFLCKDDSVYSLETSLKQIIDNSGDLHGSAFSGVEYVRRNYSWAKSAERLEQIFQSLVGC
jgi:glycosyltransferase involved in cell wall biosynthesis